MRIVPWEYSCVEHNTPTTPINRPTKADEPPTKAAKELDELPLENPNSDVNTKIMEGKITAVATTNFVARVVRNLNNSDRSTPIMAVGPPIHCVFFRRGIPRQYRWPLRRLAQANPFVVRVHGEQSHYWQPHHPIPLQ